jgi:hypothetical protein
MKGCEPRDILDRATDICLFENQSLKLTPQIVDIAWRNYFGASHTFNTSDDPLEL